MPAETIIKNSQVEQGDPELRRIEARMEEIGKERAAIEKKLEELDRQIRESTQAKIDESKRGDRVPENGLAITERIRIEKAVATAEMELDEEKDRKVLEMLRESTKKKTGGGKSVRAILSRIHHAGTKNLKRKIMYYAGLPLALVAAIASQTETAQEYWEMAKNWSERHIEKRHVDDPKIKGITDEYTDTTVRDINTVSKDLISVEKTTLDFLGSEKIDYKSGYYMTSVFDLSDRTPPKFKIINGKESINKIGGAAGITTNLFHKFYSFDEFAGLNDFRSESREEIGEIPVIGYNTKTETVRVGHYKEFDADWLISRTYEIPFNFNLNSDGTINLIYNSNIKRMVPVLTDGNGNPVEFTIGVSQNRNLRKINPYEATRFGVLDGGKIILVCGEKQVQINGSFADMFRVHERLKNKFPGMPIVGYALDNGSYNLPIWTKDKTRGVTEQMIREHVWRNNQGGTALVLLNDEAISPHEYKNRYADIEYPVGDIFDAAGKLIENEKATVALQMVNSAPDNTQVIRDMLRKRLAHVFIAKDGTRHLFGTDDTALANIGFNIALESGQAGENVLSVAQIESLLEYMRPRIERYQIPAEGITSTATSRDTNLTKSNLDDKIWKELQLLITEKLYKNASVAHVKKEAEANQMTATLVYQEAYRLTKNKEYAFNKARQILAEQGVSKRNVNRTISWLEKQLTA